MSKDNSVGVPGVFGGLMRYNEEYQSRFMVNPIQVVIAIVAFAVAIILLKTVL